MSDTGTYNNCIYVSGPVDTLRDFFDAATASGEFALAPWMDDVDDDDEFPDGFIEPCVTLEGAGEVGDEWTASWDSNCTYFDTLLRTAEAWPTLRFYYHLCTLAGDPAFHRAIYEGGNCVESDETEDPKEAREWDEWFRCEADEWIERTGEDAE
jgi:hypothetical protein